MIFRKILSWFFNERPQISRVLVIDSDPAVGKDVERLLEGHDVIIDFFQDPEEGLASFKKMVGTGERYSMAIIDWKMPKITGELLSVLLKRYDPSVQTILYTKDFDPLSFKHFRCYDVDLILHKEHGSLSTIKTLAG